MALLKVRTRGQERQFQKEHMQREQRLVQLQHRRQQLQRQHTPRTYTNNWDERYVACIDRGHPIEWWIGYSKSRGIVRKTVANHIARGLDHHSTNKDEHSTDNDGHSTNKDLHSTNKNVHYTTNMSNTGSEITSATKGIHFQTLEDRTIRKITQEHESRHVAANKSYLQKVRTTATSHRSDEISEDLKRAIRGKSAGQISLAILAESEKNLKESKKLDQLLIESDRIQRNVVGGTRIIHHVQHVDLQDQHRSIEQLGTTVGASLNDVKQQLHSMSQHALNISQISRFRRNYSPKISLYR